MSILYNFQVCEKYHDTRTRALYNIICKRIEERNEQYFLVGGFNQKDDIPILRLTEADDYPSILPPMRKKR